MSVHTDNYGTDIWIEERNTAAHARVRIWYRPKPEMWVAVLTEFDSGNGTKVNGELVTEQTTSMFAGKSRQIVPGDTIEIGGTKIVFESALVRGASDVWETLETRTADDLLRDDSISAVGGACEHSGPYLGRRK